ncbi:MAG: TetR/AcrR family transcriptional regulator [Sphingosinicella sp.]|nr:TetR/AcrR family transcriptional regulator [Sphingosinicella sp.]
MKIRNSCAEPDSCGKPGRKGAALRILETACELFYKRGIRAVGVDEIVSQAGVTKPSLYRSFGSKDELVTACLEKYAEDSALGVEAALAAAGDDPRSQLRAYVAYHAEQMSAPGFRGCPMSNLAVEFPESGQSARIVAEGCKVELRERLALLARQMPVREPEALADGILLLMEGAASTHHIFGSQGPAQCLIRAADALIESHLIR